MFCRVKTLCETCQTKLVYVDRYLDHSIFHRYLWHVPGQVEITLVTWPREKYQNKQRYDELIDVSGLYAKERGSEKYRLVVASDFHDRWLQCDDQPFQLGGSLKDAGSNTPFTLSKMDPPAENLQKIKALIASGVEIFGPNKLQHL